LTPTPSKTVTASSTGTPKEQPTTTPTPSGGTASVLPTVTICQYAGRRHAATDSRGDDTQYGNPNADRLFGKYADV
jgi:hypothetical protein